MSFESKCLGILVYILYKLLLSKEHLKQKRSECIKHFSLGPFKQYVLWQLNHPQFLIIFSGLNAFFKCILLFARSVEMQENWRKMKEEKMRQWDIHLILSYTVAALDWTFPTDRQKSSVSLRAPPVLLYFLYHSQLWILYLRVEANTGISRNSGFRRIIHCSLQLNPSYSIKALWRS